MDHRVDDASVTDAAAEEWLRGTLEGLDVLPGGSRIASKRIDCLHDPFAFLAAEFPQRACRLASELDAPHDAWASR